MLIVISPAKTLDFESTPKTKVFTTPDYLERSQQLINRLRKFSSSDISNMMNVSTKIADLNFERYAKWKKPFSAINAKQAILAFKGDVYSGLDTGTLKTDDLKFAQRHLRILSGLYGLLRPLDLIQPYRLEMGTRLKTDKAKNLYEFWDLDITEGLNSQLKKIGSDTIINLASNEYFKSIKINKVNAKIITPSFKEYKNGEYRMFGVYAKKARGLLSRYIIQNKLKDPADFKSFTEEGYRFNELLSKGNNWVFTRKK